MLCDLGHLTSANVPVSEVKYTKNISLKTLFCNARSREEHGRDRERESEEEHLSL